ncbi:MAG TPA: CBS domain-containing protein [Candidatus Limnocylindrales bacterium]|jgi:CBS-domain-containing membrane protein
MRVQDVMTRSVISVRPETPLRDVARVLGEHRISGVPVVDEAGALLGVVSEADFLVEAQGGPAVRRSAIARLFGWGGGTGTPGERHYASTASELMTSPVITIGPDELIPTAAGLMTRERINRLPVVDDGKLVGILTRADLVRTYVRTDDELAQSIRDEVLANTLWLDPKDFEVSVADGVATIRGSVDRRSSADMIARTAVLVPGVRDVNADIAWTIDDAELKSGTPGPEFPFSPE